MEARYKVIQDISLLSVEKAVNVAIDHGWIPTGGIFFRQAGVSSTFMQAIIKPSVFKNGVSGTFRGNQEG